MAYRFLDHAADIKFVARGKTLEELFCSCAEALIVSIDPDSLVKESKKVQFQVEAASTEDLLVSFLEEFLYLLDAKHFLASKICAVSITGSRLTCTVFGDDARKYSSLNHIKAVTYSGLAVVEDTHGYSCEVVLDV